MVRGFPATEQCSCGEWVFCEDRPDLNDTGHYGGHRRSPIPCVVPHSDNAPLGATQNWCGNTRTHEKHTFESVDGLWEFTCYGEQTVILRKGERLAPPKPIPAVPVTPHKAVNIAGQFCGQEQPHAAHNWLLTPSQGVLGVITHRQCAGLSEGSVAPGRCFADSGVQLSIFRGASDSNKFVPTYRCDLKAAHTGAHQCGEEGDPSGITYWTDDEVKVKTDECHD